MSELSIRSYKATLFEPERLALDSVQECAEKSNSLATFGNS